jgi:hypothetical protein
MSSTPLTLIEGAYALPRPRPLDNLPVPLRHEWALLAPGDSWRDELRSLYAALLHTVCLSNRELLSCRRWNALDRSALDGRAAITSPAAAKPAVVPRAMHHDARLDVPRDMPRKAAQAPTRVALKLHRPGTAKRRASRRWPRMAGAICIVGAVAVLAWIAMDRHGALRQLASELPRPMAIATDNRAGPAGTRQPKVEAASRQAIGVDESHAKAAHANVASTAAPVSASIRDAVSRRAPGGATPAHPPQRTQVARAQRQPVSGGQPAPSSERAHGPRVTTTRAALNTSFALPRRSTTYTDAPFAQTWPGSSEYTAITTSAAMHPRAATSNNRPANNSTEWMTHMTQRRITDIPAQFAQ